MNKNMTKLLLLVIILLFTLGVASATDNTTHTKDTSVALEKTTPTVEKVMTKTETNKKETNKTINKKDNKNNLNKEAQTIILNNNNYNEYVTNSYFNNKVNNGDIIDIQGTITKPDILYVDKTLHFITSTNDGELTGANVFRMLSGAKGSTIEGLTFKNVHLSVYNVSDVKINNITTLNEKVNIGAGVGSVNFGGGSDNITITNSYFRSVDNSGHSNVVFASAQNCLFENNVIESFGNVGNVLYFTTYNVAPGSIPNTNITIRNNTINSPVSSIISWGLVLSGYGHIIENNFINKSGIAVTSQWVDPNWDDPSTVVDSESADIIFRNNTVINGGCSLSFKGLVYDNDFSNKGVSVSSNKVYNNIFTNVSVGNDVVFEGNNVVLNRLAITGSNISINNIGNLNSFGISGSNNIISNISVNSNNIVNITGSNNTISDMCIVSENVIINGSNNVLDNVSLYTASGCNITGNNNSIKDGVVNASSTFAVIIDGKNNSVTRTYLKSGVVQGDASVKRSPDNVVENNTPESSNMVQIVDETYSNFFDAEGNSINIPNNCIVSLSGVFNNKDFVFRNINGIVSANNLTLCNSTMTLTGSTKLGFDDSFTINNRNSDKKTALIIDSDGNEFIKPVTIYAESAGDDFVTIKVTGNNNLLDYNLRTYGDKTEYTHVNGTALVIEGDNNYIYGNWIVQKAVENYTGVIFTSNSNNNTFSGTPVNTLGGTGITVGIIMSGDGNKIDDILTYTTTVDVISIVLDNANNSVLNKLRIRSNETTLILNNSHNNLIENSTYIDAMNGEYPIKLINSSNNIIKNNIIKNNQTYGGNNAVLLDANSLNNVINGNSITVVDLSDETYDELFKDGEFVNGDIINIVSDLHDKTLIFNKQVIIFANNHVLYNSPIILNSGVNEINDLVLNASNLPELLTINAKTTFNNVKINATEIPTLITINNDTSITSLDIFHRNEELITKTLVLNNAKLTGESFKMNVYGPAIETNEYTIGLEDYETDISTTAIYQNGTSILNLTGMLNINLTSTKATTGKIVALRIITETLQSTNKTLTTNLTININSQANAIAIIGNPIINESSIINISSQANAIAIIGNPIVNESSIINISSQANAIAIIGNPIVNESSIINISSQANATAIIGHPRLGESSIISIKGSTITGLVFNQLSNQTYSNLKLIINAKNAIGIYLNETIYNYTSYPTVINSEITINATDTAIGLYERNAHIVHQTNNITINAPNIIGYWLDNTHNNVTEHTFNLIGDTVTGIKVINSAYDTRTRKPVTIQNNKMNITAHTARAIEITNDTSVLINSNNVTTTANIKSILVQDSVNVNITNNYLDTQQFQGDHSIEQTNTTLIKIDSNTPLVTIILTDENYNEYFKDGVLSTDYDKVILESNLYNKDLTFTKKVEFEGNYYTVYNSTLSIITKDQVTINNLIINNTDTRESSLIIIGTPIIHNLTVYQVGNNKKVVIISNTTTQSRILRSNFTVIGNDNTLITGINQQFYNNLFYLNTLTTSGDRNMLINLTGPTTTTTCITNNTMYVYTNDAVSEIVGTNTLLNFNNNKIFINSTQGNNPIINIISGTNGQITGNYIESKDLVGKFSIVAPSRWTVQNNFPLKTLILTEENYEQEINKLQEYEVIQLGSNLYNKDITLNETAPFDGKGYTIYNGTIYTISKNTKNTINITNLNIYNTDNREHSLVVTGGINLNNTIIYQEGNNKVAVLLENNTNRISYVTNNSITIKGDNNIAIKLINYIFPNNQFNFNDIVVIGENNTAIYITSTSTVSIIVNNNITSYSSTASTPVIIDNSRVTFTQNQVVSNTTQNNIALIKVITNKMSQVSRNYIESLDLVGDNAVETPGTKRLNTPTTGDYIAKINIEDKTLIAYEENIIKVNVTDLMNRILNGNVIATVNGEDVTIIDNTIKYTPTQPGKVTLVVSYTDPNGKYQSKTVTQIFDVPVPTPKVEPTTEELILGDTTNLTAAFYTEEGTPVTDGKAIFRVNGKTLRNDKGEVIYVDVVDGKAVLPDVNITSEWAKPGTTIQAVYIGDDNNEPITTTPTTITVTKPEATITLETPAPATAGQTITLKATVTAGENNINTGRVAFKLNGKTLKNAEGKALYAEVKDGVATITYTIPEKTKAKEYTLTAVFTDKNYDRVEAESKLNVVKA